MNDSTTFLFVAKPKFAPEQVRTVSGITWSCASKTLKGNHALVYVTGEGISYEWRAISDAKPTGRTKQSPWPYDCQVEYVSAFEPPITLKELRDAIPKESWKPPHQNFRGFIAIVIPSNVLKIIRELRSTFYKAEQKFSEEVAAAQKLSREKRLEFLASKPKLPLKVKVTTEVFRRSPYVVAEVLIRARGHCGFCKSPAPFLRAGNGEPYLEVHHQIPLSDGGEDTVKNSVALCPNCHRKAHFG